MTPPTSAQAIGRFGPYELDVRSGEVRKFGIRVKLGEQPLRILILLTERPGELVTREELRFRLWSQDTFVDFDHSLNSAVQRLRETLSDTADKARWIETVPRRGYRFVGVVDWSSPNGSALTKVSTIPSTDEAVEHPLPELPAPSVPRSRIFGWRWLAAVVVLLVGAAAIIKIVRGNRALPPAATIRSLAVLPLENLSGDPSQEYFADGMTDELITALAKNRNLRVVSRTSTMQYKGAQRPVRDIARELGVDGILEGSIERSANRVHMTVQLIYAPTDTHVWAESYDRDLNQAYSLPSDLSETIAKEVKTATSPAPRQRYINPEAHDAYLRGRYFWYSFNIPQALPYFEKAIQLQPDYAAAWSGLADTYALAGMGDRPPLQVMPKVLEAARKAVELDDSLPEAHNCMAAWYLFYGWDVPRADAESNRAIELNPNYAEAHQLHAFILSAMNREAEGLAEEKRAVELDPFARPFILGMFYTDIRQYDAAISELRLQHLARPNDDEVVMNLSKAYWMKGMYKESQEEFEDGLRLQGKPETAAAAHQAWIRGGEKAVEEWSAENIKARARQGYVYAFSMASTIAFTGDKEQTLKYLEKAYREHDPDLIKMQNEPLFDFLHSDPRYHALLKKIGLQFVP
jgi:TolB-like protein/DNA-binding winged helix-turn-helix (wHTH) protein